MVTWETLKSAASRTGFAYATFKKWHSTGRLPFPVYGETDLRVKPQEVDAWLESKRRNPSGNYLI